jgi:Zn ribbon nucleic-acid-binding protein
MTADRFHWPAGPDCPHCQAWDQINAVLIELAQTTACGNAPIRQLLEDIKSDWLDPHEELQR